MTTHKVAYFELIILYNIHMHIEIKQKNLLKIPVPFNGIRLFKQVTAFVFCLKC